LNSTTEQAGRVVEEKGRSPYEFLNSTDETHRRGGVDYVNETLNQLDGASAYSPQGLGNIRGLD